MANAVGWILGHAGRRAMRSAATPRNGRRPLLDLHEGLRLLRDRRVPVRTKALAMTLGAAAVGALVAFELPVEVVVGAVLNLFGFGLDFLLDGLEMVVGPLLFGALILPHLVARVTGPPAPPVARIEPTVHGK